MATLYDLAMQYLGQALPNISGIRNTPQAEEIIDQETPVEETAPGITPQLLEPISGGGDNFNVYNTNLRDPNIRTSRNYRFPFKFTGEDLPEAGDYISNPTGIRSLLSKLIPGQQIMKGIEEIIGPNKRAILENQLLGGGFALDDIGRIVTDDYNTPQGIMAGYNAAKITDETFDKRRETVAKTLKEKYGLTDEEIEAAIAGEYKGDIPINPITGRPTDLINRLDLFNQSQNIFNKRKNIADIITDRRIEERRQERRNAEEAAFAAAGGDRQQQAMQRARDQQAIDAANRAYRDDPGSYSGSYDPKDDTSYNDPFDPGGGE